jgi:RHS repeat-associated protein
VLATYTYDAFDRRIGVREGSATRWTLYDGSSPVLDFDGSGTQVARYLNGPDASGVDAALARETSGGTVAWYLPDRLGTVRDLVGNSGGVIDHVDYGVFGNVVGETSPAEGDAFKFAGMRYDAAVRLEFDRARWYDPASGRFVSRDPIGFAAGDTNIYRYVGNEPTDFSDPSGLLEPPSAGDLWEYLKNPRLPFDLPSGGELWAYLKNPPKDTKKPPVEIPDSIMMILMMISPESTNNIYAHAQIERINGILPPLPVCAVQGPGGVHGGGPNFSIVQSSPPPRRVRFRPSDPANPGWGLTPTHLRKHFFGSQPTALEQIDPGGTADKWAQHLAELIHSPVTGTTSNGMLDIIKSFPRADGSGTFKLGVRLAPRPDGTCTLITVLTKQ